MAKKEDNIILRIAEAIAPYRKRTERYVGCVPYKLKFEIRSYNGTSQKPLKVNVITKTIIKLIAQGLTDINDIAEAMGMSYKYDLEKMILKESVDHAQKNLEFIRGSRHNLALTYDGQDFYRNGELVKKYQSSFEIVVAPISPDFPYLRDIISKHPGVMKKSTLLKKENLSLLQIKNIAEVQATNVQHSETKLELINAEMQKYVEAEIQLYVCFMQDIRDNSIRTIIYDDVKQITIPKLSSLFDDNNKLRDSLLRDCLKKEVEEETIEKVDSGEKTEDQIHAEDLIIANENSTDKHNEKDNHKEVGSVYDSMEFEMELSSIFSNQNNQEIWLISPWIRNYAFLRSREPKIRDFLNRGGAIFIGYSEPEKMGEQMVEPMSMSVIERLEQNYERFYYTELPKFHMKNVIEYNGNNATLYTGSFNVLSFCISESTEHYRMEQMMLANENTANEARNKYLNYFTQKYIHKYITDLETLQKGSKLNAPKLSYLDKCGVLQENLDLLKNESGKDSVEINVPAIEETRQKELIEIAKRVVSLDYKKDANFIQAYLSACLFLLECAKTNKNESDFQFVEQKLNQILMHNSIYGICRFNLRPGYEDNRKSVVRVIYKDKNFEFMDVSLQRNAFLSVNKHKEIINFKEEGIRLIKEKSLEVILYNSAKDVLHL